MSVEDIVAQLTDINHVVLTGGEPMLFDAVVPLSEQCRQHGKTITIETAGTLFREVECDLMSISPKLSSSVPVHDSHWASRHDALRLQPAVLQQLVDRYNYQLKFVISTLDEVEEVKDLLLKLKNIDPQKVMLMPEGRDPVALWDKARQLVPIVMQHNWRLAPRLQIDLFGDTKGT